MYVAKFLTTLAKFGMMPNKMPYGYKPSYDNKRYVVHPEISRFIDRMYKQWVLPLKDKE